MKIKRCSWHDNYWGNCYCFKCKDIKGVNKLGEPLMDIRSRLAPEEK